MYQKIFLGVSAIFEVYFIIMLIVILRGFYILKINNLKIKSDIASHVSIIVCFFLAIYSQTAFIYFLPVLSDSVSFIIPSGVYLTLVFVLISEHYFIYNSEYIYIGFSRHKKEDIKIKSIRKTWFSRLFVILSSKGKIHRLRATQNTLDFVNKVLN